MRRRSESLTQTGPNSNSAGDTNSLYRGLSVLGCFRYGDKTLSINELAQQLFLPKATIQKLVDTLVADGFLSQVEGSDYYQPDRGCFELGHAWYASSAIIKAARPRMQHFSLSYGVNVILAKPNQSDMICIECCSQLIAGQMAATLGLSVPIISTAIGRAWLWAQPSPIQGEIVQRIRSEGGEHVSTEISGMYRAFQEMETQGYCYSTGEWMRNISAFGTAIVLKNGTSYGLCCDVSTPGIFDRHSAEELGKALVQLAMEIKVAAERAVL